MKYNELLCTEEWNCKCDEILDRDRYTCKDCGCIGYHNGGNFMKVSKLEELDSLFKGLLFYGMPLSKFLNDIPYNKPYSFKGIECYFEREIEGLMVYDLDMYNAENNLFDDIFVTPISFKLVSEKKIENIDATVYEISAINNQENSSNNPFQVWAYLYEFPYTISNNIYVNIEQSIPFIIDDIPHSEDVINITWDNRLLSIRSLSFPFPLKGLNIHHKYYIRGKKPWQYDNSALVTLCEDCHKKRHESSFIRFYDSSGKTFTPLIPCDRCGGSGYLPQFNHVANGICFKCYGEGVVLDDII